MLELLPGLGLTHAVGFLRFSPNVSPTREYVPYHVFLGVPLKPLPLCRAVCSQALEQKFLDPTKASLITADQQRHVDAVQATLHKFSKKGPGLVPLNGFIFDGKKLKPNDAIAPDILATPFPLTPSQETAQMPTDSI